MLNNNEWPNLVKGLNIDFSKPKEKDDSLNAIFDSSSLLNLEVKNLKKNKLKSRVMTKEISSISKSSD